MTCKHPEFTFKKNFLDNKYDIETNLKVVAALELNKVN